MSDIQGKLVDGEKELRRIASKRRKPFLEQSLRHDQVDLYEKKGWQVVRRGKNITRLRINKPIDMAFEDRVWMIFYRLGFSCMNSDRQFKLNLEPDKKQIDVFAKDKDNVFIVECKSSASSQPINVRQELEYFAGKRDEIQRALEAEYGRHFGRLNTVIVLNSQEKRPDDEEYIKEKKEFNIHLWSSEELDYIENLISQVGETAKYQLYSVLFADKKQRSLKKDYLALRCKIGGHNCYSFMMPAKELMSYAYIHHRKLTGIIEASQAYQRMLNCKKLEEIAKYIDDEKGFFPNSVIINFTKRIGWQNLKSIEDVIAGIITLPEYYGCAWIIDGQHRLYGIASSKGDVTLPVLAFEGLDQKDQANIFVDINEKQKKVPPDLLWDLYSDLYIDSTDERQIFLYEVAQTAKKLDERGALKGQIEIPSVPKEKLDRLSLTTVCTAIQKYSPWNNLKHPTDPNRTPDNAARLIGIFYKIIFELWPEERSTEKHNRVILTNNGFAVFMMVFSDILNHLGYMGKQQLFSESKQKELEAIIRNDYLTPLIEHLKINEKLQRDIRKNSGYGLQSYNAAFLDLKINEFIPGYAPPRTEINLKYEKLEQPVAIPAIEEKARRAEGHIRAVVLEKIKQHYGSDKWWRQALTDGAKKDADKAWKTETSRKPWTLREEKEINETKFGYIGLGQLLDIICYGQNWPEIFEPMFSDKDHLKRRIQDIMALRNPVSHSRKMEDQDVLDGTGGLLWLSKCIDEPELNPFK